MFLFNPCSPCCGCAYNGQVHFDPWVAGSVVVPYLFDTSTGEVCSYSNPSGTNMLFHPSDSGNYALGGTISFWGSQSNTFVAWFNSPGPCPSSLLDTGGCAVEPGPLLANINNTGNNTLYLNDAPVSANAAGQVRLNETTNGAHGNPSWAGCNTGDQSDYSDNGAIINIRCECPEPNCLSSGDPLYLFVLPNYLVKDTLTSVPLSYLGSGVWYGDYPDVPESGIMATGGETGGSVRCYVVPSTGLDESVATVKQLRCTQTGYVNGPIYESIDTCLDTSLCGDKTFIHLRTGAFAGDIISPYPDKFWNPACSFQTTVPIQLFLNVSNVDFSIAYQPVELSTDFWWSKIDSVFVGESIPLNLTGYQSWTAPVAHDTIIDTWQLNNDPGILRLHLCFFNLLLSPRCSCEAFALGCLTYILPMLYIDYVANGTGITTRVATFCPTTTNFSIATDAPFSSCSPFYAEGTTPPGKWQFTSAYGNGQSGSATITFTITE